jgi:hypothetical protein
MIWHCEDLFGEPALNGWNIELRHGKFPKDLEVYAVGRKFLEGNGSGFFPFE